ncbi:META domain-containing protein [Limibacter armeniacum]|uniref:META domain-containing protein n=1 Tax=Limibacter armeniacum TaxID=466084 RepID=UPI002FE69C71
MRKIFWIAAAFAVTACAGTKQTTKTVAEDNTTEIIEQKSENNVTMVGDWKFAYYESSNGEKEAPEVPVNLKVVEDKEGNIRFGGKIFNSFNGGFEVLDNHNLKVTPIAMTRMMPPNPEPENKFVGAIQKANAYELTDNKLTLTYDGGKLVFTK